MGCSSPQNAGRPHIPAQHLNRLRQVAQISHPLNVNKKYQLLSRIDQSKKTGKGCKMTFAYHALGTKQQIQEKRKQFWQTRTSGQSAIWQALHQVVRAPNEQQALTLLQQHNITMIDQTVQMCVDTRFNKYQVPIFCINEPLSYSINSREDRDLQFQYEDKMLDITIRSTKYPNGDMKFSMQASTDISVIKQTIKSDKSLPDTTNIRLFYAGKEMKADRVLGNYGYVSGTVIQAMIL